MQISAMYSQCNNPIASRNDVSFQAWRREVRHKENNYISHRNDTAFTRDGSSFWKDTVRFLSDKYKGMEKVNVINYACSDGSEPYTFVMGLLSDKANNNDKFLPIIAKDFDEVAINRAKANDFVVFDEEIYAINNLTDKNIDKYMEVITPKNQLSHLHAKETLKSKVKFSKADIFKDYKNIPSKNSVVLARNFWGYLENDAIKLAELLGKQMKKNCILIIGKYDLDSCLFNNINLDKLLQKNGFRVTQNKLIYERKPVRFPFGKLLAKVC